MATWQFTFYIIPKEKLVKYNLNLNSTLNDYDFDEMISWNGYKIEANSLEKLSYILNLTKSWSKNIKQFGSIDGTCIELFYERGLIEHISVRIDLFNITNNVFSTIINFINDNDAIILTIDGKVIEPKICDLIDIIQKSDPYSFVRDPYHFFETLSDNKNN